MATRKMSKSTILTLLTKPLKAVTVKTIVERAVNPKRFIRGRNETLVSLRPFRFIGIYGSIY